MIRRPLKQPRPGIGDLYRIYATAQRDDVDFNLTFIPSTFDFPHKEEFDNESTWQRDRMA